MDFSRQLKVLYHQSNDLLKEDGVLANGMFYQKLNDFIKFYEETRTELNLQIGVDNPMALDRINALPDIEYRDYDNPFSAKTIVYLIGYLLFFPIDIAYFVNKYSYVSRTKSTIRQISASISSIEFLLRNN